MSYAELFKAAVNELRKRNIKFALAGGLVASLYRDQPRTTNDIDFLILADSNSQQAACDLIKAMGLVPHVATRAQLEGGPMFAIKSGRSPVLVVVGRREKDRDAPGLDFILPTMPWFEAAFERAQHNTRNFGFGDLPCLCKEDLILAKMYSLANDNSRLHDLSDLRSIFKEQTNIDLNYLSDQMERLKLTLPASFANEAPALLKKVDKRLRRNARKEARP